MRSNGDRKCLLLEWILQSIVRHFVTQPGTSRRTKPYLGRNQLQCNSEALLLGQQSERFSLQDIKSLIGQDTFSKQEWHHQ